MLKILLIDDDRNEHSLVAAYLGAHYKEAHELISAYNLTEALTALQATKFDAVLLDNRLRPYKSFSQTLPAIVPYLYGGSLYVISASVREITVAEHERIHVLDVIDKFDLRHRIFEGLLDKRSVQ